MTTIGLCMIVKNESRVIVRCLESLRPLLDFVLIEDTGSTDGTQTIIRDYLRQAGLPGVVIEEPWRDFAYNRSHALARLRERLTIDYALIMDADDEMVFEAGFDAAAFKKSLTRDMYSVKLKSGAIRHQRLQICSNRKEFSYRGVLHEFLAPPPGEVTSATAEGLLIMERQEGARSADPEKYAKDAAILEHALLTETDPFLVVRYTFYLAQSYRDRGDTAKAIEAYLRRAEMGGWDQEIFHSLYRAAQLKEALGDDPAAVIAIYLRASDVAPNRAEALHGASRLCRNTGRHQEGFDIAKRGLGLTAPDDGLFVEAWIYDWGLRDEFAVNASWTGHYHDCLEAFVALVSSPKCPEEHRARYAEGVRFALDRLPKDPNLGSFGSKNLIQQHELVAPRPLRSRVVGEPRVLVAILAKQKEPSLPLYLACIEALDYPKSAIVLYIRTNNNTDGTERILREWVARVGHLYAGVEFDTEDVAARVEQFGVHEWNATRFRVLGQIRNVSLRRTKEHGCDFYFVADVDNFVRPCTLRELVALDLPIVAPLLRSIDPRSFYSNYHAEIDSNGYYKECDQYHWILNRWVRGVLELPLVHCTYLVRGDVLSDLNYQDATDRFEYVVFSDSARRSGVQQYFDNRQVYGYITFDEGGVGYIAGGLEQARALLAADLSKDGKPAQPRVSSDGQVGTAVVSVPSRPSDASTAELAEIENVLALLTPYGVPGFNKVRIGHDSDGGYVMLDDLDHAMVCYSLGVAGEVSWDLELANRGAVIFQYDDSVDGPPIAHPNFHFRRIRIASDNSSAMNTVRLDTLVDSNADFQGKYAILNMDIEGSEWDVIDSVDAGFFGGFSQVTIEFHGLERLREPSFREFAKGVLHKLCQTLFPVHIHGNNWGKLFAVGEFECPDVMEVTFVNRAKYPRTTDPGSYPTLLDRPCRRDWPDIDLSRFPVRPQSEELV